MSKRKKYLFKYNQTSMNFKMWLYLWVYFRHTNTLLVMPSQLSFPHLALNNMSSFYFQLYNKTKPDFMTVKFLGCSFGLSVLGPAQIACSPFTLFVWHARRQTALRAPDIITGRLSFLWRVSETAEPPGTMTTKPLSPYWHKNTPPKP